MTLAQSQWRRGTAAQWTAANPVLLNGEPGWEQDTSSFKVGDGVTAWNSLPYFDDVTGITTTFQSQINVLGPRAILDLDNTASGTFFNYTDYAYLKYAKITAVGGGGPGGGAATTSATQVAAGSGGGGGGVAVKIMSLADFVAAGTSILMTIAGTAAGGIGGTNPVSDGGSTSFGSFCVAGGGLKGASSAATSTNTSYTAGPPAPVFGVLTAGGAGGIGTTGDMIFTGSKGGHGYAMATGAAFGAEGGMSALGYAGKQNTSSSASNDGIAGNNYGGGGSGGHNTISQVTARNGGAGAQGLLIIELFG